MPGAFVVARDRPERLLRLPGQVRVGRAAPAPRVRLGQGSALGVEVEPGIVVVGFDRE